MDSPVSARGRNRSRNRSRNPSTTRKRHSVPARSSSHHFSEPVDHQPMSNTQQAAEMPPSSSFTFETPSPSNQKGTRKRTRQPDGFVDPSPDDAESKGGRSLRKRTRVDYSFDQLDYDETDGPKSTPTANRSSRKQKSDTAFHDEEIDEDVESRAKRRASEQPPQVAPRRRGPYKRSTIGPTQSLPAMPPFYPDPQIDNVEVRDTIEVGGHHSSQSDEASQRRASSTSSHVASSSPQLAATQDTVVVQETTKGPLIADDDSAADPPRRQGPILGDGSLPEEELEAAHTSLDSKQVEVDSLEHLTPYVEGVYTLYPVIQQEEEPDPEAEVVQEDVPQLADVADDAIEAAEGAEEETPFGSPKALGTRVNSPAPGSDAVDVAPTTTRTQYRYKQITSVSEITSLFSDVASLSEAELYRRLEIANKTMVAWQEEYNKLRYLTDDEDNAQRYKNEEALFQHRKKMAISKDPNANPIQKDFVLKGARAPKPSPLVAYARQQDRIMANSWLFDYDDRESKIGKQDPAAQRAGFGKGRLRDRPKQTAKAAEADDGNVVVGKRTRKAPVLYDGVEANSRGSTPAPAPVRRRRRAPGAAAGHNAVEENGDVQLLLPPLPSSQLSAGPTSAPQSSQPGPNEPETPKRKGKGGRPRKHPLPAPPNDDPPSTTGPVEPEAGAQSRPQPELTAPEKPTRKGRRKEPVAEDGPVDHAGAATQTNTHHHEEHARPHTASSTATVSTIASNYQLREKRRTNFSSFDYKDVHEQRLEEEQENPQQKPRRQRKRQPKQQQQQPQPQPQKRKQEAETKEAQEDGQKTPRPKRVRRAPKKIQGEDLAAFQGSMPTLAPAPALGPANSAAPAVQLPDPPVASITTTTAAAPTAGGGPTTGPKPPTRIKIKNYHPPALSIPAAAAAPPPQPSPSEAATPQTKTHSHSATNGTGADGEGKAGARKDYSTMTKSEKMSRSMKGTPTLF